MMTVALLVLYRLFCARVVVSFFDPDEYWQSMEVAHSISFGYGHLTWEWAQQIRSFLHPLLFASLYSTLRVLHLDSPWAVQWVPRFFQAMILAAQDILVYLLALRLIRGAQRFAVARWAFILECCLWFNIYCGVRTYSNCAETFLITLALLFWPLSVRTSSHLGLALFFAGFSVAMRPTAAIFWAVMVLVYLMQRPRVSQLIQFVGWCGVMGVLWIVVIVVSDGWLYGRWVFVPWQFVQFNVLRGVGSYYGTHPMHWYFTEAIFVVFFTVLPMILVGVVAVLLRMNRPALVRNMPDHQLGALLSGSLLFVLVFSLLGHKEFRFLYPIVPSMMVVGGYGVYSFLESIPSLDGILSRGKRRWLVIALLLVNVPMTLYFSQAHQVGTTSVMEHIQQDETISDVFILLPCHQTPYYSFVHRPLALDFPDCSPPVGDDPSLVGYRTENSEFLRDPAEFLRTLFLPSQNSRPSWLHAERTSFPRSLPSHFVTYEKIAVQRGVEEFMVEHGYQRCQQFFHTLTPLDEIQSDVILFCRNRV